MEISRVLAAIGSDDVQARQLAEYAERNLDFSGDITNRTDIATHARDRAMWAADDFAERTGFEPRTASVEKAIAILTKLGIDHQDDLIDRSMADDPISDRAAQYGDWRNAQREVDELERDR